ncbi:MAG: TolC family protein [Myxococcota bacterium]
MFFSFVAFAFAQEPTALSLEEALRRAQAASEDIVYAEAGVESARGDKMGATSGLLPQVSGSASYQHTFASEYDGLFETPDAADGGASPFSGLPFGQADTYRVDLALSQTIWAGGRNRAAMRMADAGREVAGLSVESARASAALAATQAYYDAALADQLVDIATGALTQAETTAAHAKLAHEVGRQPEFELVRADVEVQAQRVVVIQQTRVRTIAHLQLKRLLDLPPDATLSLTTPLDDGTGPAEAAATVAAVGSGARAAVEQAEKAVRLSEASLALTRSQRYPTLGASANYGWVSYPSSVVPEFGEDAWRNNFTAGLVLSVPIFSGLRVTGELVSARAALTQAEARLSQAGELAALDTADADAAIVAASAQWDATAGTVAQAERAYSIAEVRFQEGISTQSELADARLLLQRARASRAQAARDLQIARVRLALLPALPLGGAQSY